MALDEPYVFGLAKSVAHTFSKVSCDHLTLVEGLGVEHDAHAGVTVQHLSRIKQDPGQPNLRQVHLIHGELLDELAEHGYVLAPGALGENVTTRVSPSVRSVGAIGAAEAAVRNPHGVIQMLSPCVQPWACVAVMFWASVPAGCGGTPGTSGGCVVPVARETS